MNKLFHELWLAPPLLQPLACIHMSSGSVLPVRVLHWCLAAVELSRKQICFEKRGRKLIDNFKSSWNALK